MAPSDNTFMKHKNSNRSKKDQVGGKGKKSKSRDKSKSETKSNKADGFSSDIFQEINRLDISKIVTKDLFRLADLFFYREFQIYKHALDSYNWLLDEAIKRYLLEGNHVFSEILEDDILYRNKLKYTNIRYQSPTFNNKVDPLYPSDARYRSMTYSVTLYADVTQYLEKEKMSGKGKVEVIKVGKTEKGVQIGHIPLMLRSKYCNLTVHGDVDDKECNYDPGCYFIVNGTEKVVISQDRIKENTPHVFLKKDSSSKYYVVQVKSRPYDPFEPEQTITVRLKKDGQMTIRVPIMAEVDVFALFRALGVESGRDIINCITADETDPMLGNIIKAGLDKCVDDKGNHITTREKAYDYLISKLRVIPKTSNTSIRNKMEQNRLNLTRQLKKNFLPHISGSLKKKAMYLGFMLNKLIRTSLGIIPLSDRDSYQNKRVDTVGALMLELFQTQMRKQTGEISKFFNSRTDDYNNPYIIIGNIKPSTIEQGIKAALSTGAWIRKKGVAQMVQRLTYLHFISFLRRIDAPSGDKQNSKLTSPRFLHPSSTGLLCPVQTPESANVGLNKHLNLLTSISIINKDTYDAIRTFILKSKEVKSVTNVPYKKLKYMYKLFLNGDWVGMLDGIGPKGLDINNSPPAIKFYEKFLKKKHQKVFNPEVVSIVLDTSELEIKIYCDSGRMYRPVLRVGPNNVLNLKKEHIEKISLDKMSSNKITDWDEFTSVYPDVIDYIDMEEQPGMMIADKISTLNKEHVKMYKSRNYKFKGKSETDIVNRYNQNHFVRYTHCEIHPSLLVGEISVNIVFMDSNQAPRNVFQYSQARQAMGTYATNYRDRMDISHILYNPQKQVVTTRGSKYINSHILAFGINAIVGIATYTGFNQEDSLIMNETSLDRGMFRSTFIRKYSSSITKNQTTSDDDKFMKPDPKKTARMKAGSYEKLNVMGYVPPETKVQNGDILFGKVKPMVQNTNSTSEKEWSDESESYRMIPSGVVDRVQIGIVNPDSGETRKMTVRSERFVHVGDKFSCYTPDHEILTESGWIPIADVTKEHKVACLMNGDTLEYHTPKKIQEYDCDEDIYYVKSNHVDLRVTLNHRMYVGSRDKKRWGIVEASECLGKQRCYKKNVENFVPRKYKKIKTTKKGRYFILPAADGKKKKKLEMEYWLKMFGIWMAEGCVVNNTVCYAAHKKRVRDCLDECSKKLKIKFGCTAYCEEEDCYKVYRIYSKRYSNVFRKYSVGAVNKHLPKWAWYLTREEARWFIHGMVLGDGHTMKNGTRRYDTSSKQFANDFQRLCLHAGYSCNIAVKYKAGRVAVIKKKGREGETITSTADAYRMTIIEKQNTPLVNKNVAAGKQLDGKVKYTGKVHCCTVPGDGIVYVRRNGVAVWCGNSNHGQKGTCGIQLPASSMPHTKHGIRPDIILNPNAIPSRMTIGQIIECMVGKNACLRRMQADGTPFEERDVEDVRKQLGELGYDPNGVEEMYNGFTGRKMNIPIFIGPTYYCRLKHMVEDKIHARARGPKTMLTHQALEGRSRDGGLRVGEMERDSLIAHGMSRFLKEKLMDSSDPYATYVCGQCGLFAQRYLNESSERQPRHTDVYWCRKCDNYNDVHRVMLPYACKLMFQELMAMAVAPRIRIERPDHHPNKNDN